MQAVTEKWKENRNRPLTSEGFVEIVYAVNDPNAVTAAYGTQQHELSPMPLGWNPPLTDETAHTVVPYATLEQNQWLQGCVPGLECVRGMMVYYVRGAVAFFSATAPFLYFCNM